METKNYCNKTITPNNVHVPRPLGACHEEKKIKKEDILTKIDEVKQLIDNIKYK